MLTIYQKFINKLKTRADYYKIKPAIFITLYIFSFIPFYLGIYLILKGLDIEISTLKDLITTNFQLNFDNQLVVWGILINRLAWSLPYLYIEFFGQNLKWYYHILIWLWISSSFINFVAR